jgi:hypothetical protein
MGGGTTVEETGQKKAAVVVVEVFEDATFRIHKWHSNTPELEPTNEVQTEPEEITYSKNKLGGVDQPEGKLLGLSWNRQQDTLAKIYDPLGLVFPTTLVGKLIYRDVCDAKLPWDASLPLPLTKRWKEWNDSLETFTVPQSLTLHGFGDASSRGVSMRSSLRGCQSRRKNHPRTGLCQVKNCEA